MGVVYLLRHGQASFGAADYDVLSETGRLQAERAGRALAARAGRLDLVVSGSLRRQRDTAALALAGFPGAPPCTDDRAWDEYDHLDVLQAVDPALRDRAGIASRLAREERPREAFKELFERALERWTSGLHDADYRESLGAFLTRVEAGLERVLATLHPSGTALVVTSGGPIAAVCHDLLRLPPARAFEVAGALVNGGFTKLVASPRGVRLSTLNEHGHLEEPGRTLVTYR